MQDSQFSVNGLVLLGELGNIKKCLDIFDVNNATNAGNDELIKGANFPYHSEAHQQRPMDDLGESIEREPSRSFQSLESQVHLQVLGSASASTAPQLHSRLGGAERESTRSTGNTVQVTFRSEARKLKHRKSVSNAIDQLFQGLP